MRLSFSTKLLFLQEIFTFFEVFMLFHMPFIFILISSSRLHCMQFFLTFIAPRILNSYTWSVWRTTRSGKEEYEDLWGCGWGGMEMKVRMKVGGWRLEKVAWRQARKEKEAEPKILGAVWIIWSHRKNPRLISKYFRLHPLLQILKLYEAFNYPLSHIWIVVILRRKKNNWKIRILHN